jgi:hypothetical protein
MDGDEIRKDDFFVTRPDGGALADEVGEAVLIAVREEAEQRKVPYMGYLLANIAFEPGVDAASAHNLVAEAEALSFTQLSLLAAVARQDKFSLPGRREGGVTASLEVLTLLSQFEDLGYARRELIGVVSPKRGLPENISVPKDQVLQYRGKVLYSLMELARIPDEDVRKVVDVLWAGFRPKPSTE